MNKLLGYSLMGTGLFGLLFFLNYKGLAIPLKELWFVLCFFITIVGAYFIAKDKLKKSGNEQSDSSGSRLAEIEALKRTSDKVRVTLDNSEVNSRGYQQEMINEDLPSNTEMLDALYDSNRNFKAIELQQTYIVFYKQYGEKTYKFISQPTTQNADTLRRYIISQKGIDLYINPKHPARYYFDLPSVLR